MSTGIPLILLYRVIKYRNSSTDNCADCCMDSREFVVYRDGDRIYIHHAPNIEITNEPIYEYIDSNSCHDDHVTIYTLELPHHTSVSRQSVQEACRMFTKTKL